MSCAKVERIYSQLFRGMRDVVKSSSGKSDSMSYAAVQKALAGLEEKGALLKAGDTTREGTLYKVCLPDEIELCKESMVIRHGNNEIAPIDEETELDFYNVVENRNKVFERDGYQCHYCQKQLTRFTATLDHIQPVSRGGDNSFTNLVTSCLHCNSRRGNRPVMDMYANREPDDR